VNLSKRLLIVDDEPNLLRAVAACLRGEGYEVDTARSGEEALVHVAQRLPDLIVSDIRMPRMDGYAFARQLRTNPRTDLIPIVFLTAKMKTLNASPAFAQASMRISLNLSSRTSSLPLLETSWRASNARMLK
jgi:CheY-like chemotaxis protein